MNKAQLIVRRAQEGDTEFIVTLIDRVQKKLIDSGGLQQRSCLHPSANILQLVYICLQILFDCLLYVCIYKYDMKHAHK